MSGIKLPKARKFVISGAAAVAVALPLAMVSAPAQAATTLNGCTVTPLRPSVVVVGGQEKVYFPTRVHCVADRIVRIQDQRLERDDPAGIAGDDSFGQTIYTETFEAGATRVVSRTIVVASTEDSNEEVYHRARFKVASINGVSNWTSYENSPVRSVDK